MGRKLVFDLETQKTFDEVGGYNNTHLLGISVCGVYDYETQQYRAYREQELSEMERLFGEASLLIGFNSKHFDNTVLQPYFKKLKLVSIPHLDIMEEIVKQLGFRMKLESVAQSTLLTGKSGSGIDAIRYFREGDWDKLIGYCLDDVKVTKDLYEYGRRHGQLWYTSSGKLQAMPAAWGEHPTVVEQLAAALKNRQQIEIEYIKVMPTGTQRERRLLDVKAMDHERVRAFDHTVNEERIFSIAKIFSLRVSGDMESFQPSLL